MPTCGGCCGKSNCGRTFGPDAIFHLFLYTGGRISDLVALELHDLIIGERSGSVVFRYRLRTVRKLLDRKGQEQQQFEFLESHPIIRPLSDYSLASLLQFRKDRHYDEH